VSTDFTPPSDRSEYVDSLRRDCRANLPKIRELVDEIEDYFPNDLLYIVDSRSMFDDPDLFTRFRETMVKCEALESGGGSS
jgi:hypothetical protein